MKGEKFPEMVRAQEDIEAVVATAEVSVDWAPHEVDALLRWLKAFAEMRLIEREIEEFDR